MKKVTYLLLVVSLLPTLVLAWNTPREDFNGELKLGGLVTNTRNPWVWKIGEGNKNIDVMHKLITHQEDQAISISLPSMIVLLGKTTFTTPTGRENLAPKVIYGRDTKDFSIKWNTSGVAEVTLPVTDDNNLQVGVFTFRMRSAAVLRYVQSGQVVYSGLYDDIGGNGLPGQTKEMPVELIPGLLRTMFNGEGPGWLQTMTIGGTTALSRFRDASLRQVEGVYGAQIVADSGKLYLKREIPSRWHLSLPVSIEYP